jgi:hypothetical protein
MEVYEILQSPTLDYETRPALSRGIDQKIVLLRLELRHGANLARTVYKTGGATLHYRTEMI